MRTPSTKEWSSRRSNSAWRASSLDAPSYSVEPAADVMRALVESSDDETKMAFSDVALADADSWVAVACNSVAADGTIRTMPQVP